MRKLHWLVTRPEGLLVGRYGLKTRIQNGGWDPVPLSPVEAVPRIAPTPLLIVHGERDGYFPVDHPGCWPRPPPTTRNSGWSRAWATRNTRPPTTCWPVSVAGAVHRTASLAGVDAGSVDTDLSRKHMPKVTVRYWAAAKAAG